MQNVVVLLDSQLEIYVRHRGFGAYGGERLRCEPSSCGSFSVVSWNTAVGLSRFNTSAQWFRAAAQLGMIPVQAKETFSECLSDCESMTRAFGTAAGAAGRHYADLMTGAYAGRPVIVAVTDFVERRPPPLIQIGDVPAWSVRVLSTWTFAAAQMTAPLFVGLTIDRSGARSGPDLVVGEPAFDQAFGVWAADPSRAIELLRRRGRPSELIDVLADFARQGLSVTIADDFVRVGLARVVLDAASIEQWLRALHWSERDRTSRARRASLRRRTSSSATLCSTRRFAWWAIRTKD